MRAELVKTFRFEAAHSLPQAGTGHKCTRMHGHSYRVDVHVEGPIDPRQGWVMDFGDLKAVVEGVLGELDHRLLNEIPGLANSTSEMIAVYLWERIAQALPNLSAITVWESDSSRCIYRGR